MKKQDLKTGMILEFNRNNERAIVLLDTENGDIVCGDTWFPLESYNDNLEYNDDTSYSYVTKIYQPLGNRSYINELKTNWDKKLLWKRA